MTSTHAEAARRSTAASAALEGRVVPDGFERSPGVARWLEERRTTMADEYDYEAARAVIKDIIQSWVVDESDWFYEDDDLVEGGYDIETLRTVIWDTVENIA